ncbi:hypothetical protein D3C75_440190 [compost metagenome]
MGDAVDQLFLTGNQGVDIIGHLVKGHAETLKAGGAVKMNPLCQMPVTKALGGGLETENVLPVGAHPDKHREGQRDGDKGQQGDIQQAHLMQEIEIRYRAHRQHIVTARDALDKGVLFVKRHNVAAAKTLHRGRIQDVFLQRLDAQLKRQVQVQLF